MVFADLFFIYVFLPLCLICYSLAKKLSTKNIVLIVFSLIFYAWGEPLWILLLLFSSFFNWFIGILIGKFRDTPRAKLAVGGGILVDILLLLIFKYSAFIVENLNAVSGAAIPVPQITLPIFRGGALRGRNQFLRVKFIQFRNTLIIFRLRVGLVFR